MSKTNKQFHKSFTAKLRGVINSANKQRENVQELVQLAFDHAKNNNNDFTYLSMLVRDVIGVRALNTKALMGYIKAHVHNIGWTKTKTKNDGIRYQWKKVGKNPIAYEPELSGNWWEFETGNSGERPTYDRDKLIGTMKRSMTRYAKENNTTETELAGIVHEVAGQAGDILVAVNEQKLAEKAADKKAA